jgi:hypothetical protein
MQTLFWEKFIIMFVEKIDNNSEGWNMGNEYIKKQEKNREDALEHISKWLDCFLKADPQHKNLLGKDFIELLTIKAQGNEELNEKLNQVIKSMGVMGKAFE